MQRDDDLEPRRKVTHEIGADLSAVSVGELEERIGLLREEIARIEREIVAKKSSKDAAAAVFKL